MQLEEMFYCPYILADDDNQIKEKTLQFSTVVEPTVQCLHHSSQYTTTTGTALKWLEWSQVIKQEHTQH